MAAEEDSLYSLSIPTKCDSCIYVTVLQNIISLEKSESRFKNHDSHFSARENHNGHIEQGVTPENSSSHCTHTERTTPRFEIGFRPLLTLGAARKATPYK